MIPVSQQSLSDTDPTAHPRRRARAGLVLGAAFLLALIALPIATAAAPAAGPAGLPAAQAATATVGAADAVQTGAPAPVQTGGAAQPVLTGAPAPAIGSTQPVAPAPADSGAPWLPWLVGAVLVAGLAGLGVFALRQRSLTPVAPVQGLVPAGGGTAAAATGTPNPAPPPAQVRCPNCDAMNPADRRYCDECGQDLQPAVAPVATPAAAPAVDEATTPYLETLSRADEQLEYVLARGTVNIGRALDNDVVIDDQFIGWQTVSPHHARLTREEDGFAIEDLSSDNGTFVNGARTGDNVLADGMVLALGKVEFIYRVPHE